MLRHSSIYDLYHSEEESSIDSSFGTVKCIDVNGEKKSCKKILQRKNKQRFIQFMSDITCS